MLSGKRDGLGKDFIEIYDNLLVGVYHSGSVTSVLHVCSNLAIFIIHSQP